MIHRKTIEFQTPPQSLNWNNGRLIDWAGGGNEYFLSGEFKESSRAYSYRFDSAIQSDNGVYALIFEKLGTKGLLLKNGEVLRELNRSYYQAGVYEYPISFVKLSGDRYALIHCPSEYNLLEFELIESGEMITQSEGRMPDDCFHSRLRVNESNNYLLNAGWVWHPYGILKLYDIVSGIKDNQVFDDNKSIFPTDAEICSAEFLTDDLIVVSATAEEALNQADIDDGAFLNPGQIGAYSIGQKRFIKKITVDFKLGTLVPIDENFVLDLYEYPKLVDLNSGEINQRFEDIDSGKQDSSIIHHIEKIPPMAISQDRKKIAFGNGRKIEILEIT